MPETLQIVVNEWCPAQRLELVACVKLARPTRKLDPEIFSIYAKEVNPDETK